jgi:hypothetical protein
MKYISASVVSGSFGTSLINANQIYAVPIILASGTHVFNQVLMHYQYGTVRVALYSDVNDYPGSLILDVGLPTQHVQNILYDFSPISLSGGKYWIVCVANKEVATTSYLGQANPLLISTIGVDILRNDSIVGYTIGLSYKSSFPSVFSSGAKSLIGTDSIPLVLLRETSFIPDGGGGGSGISGISGFSGNGGGGSGISGVSGHSGFSGNGFSGFSGHSGFSGNGISGFSGISESGFSGHSGFSGSFINKTTQSPAGDYQTLITDYIVSKIGISISGDTVTLPLLSSSDIGQSFVVSDESGTASEANPITVKGSGSELIDGVNSIDITVPYGSLQIFTDGSQWFTV